MVIWTITKIRFENGMVEIMSKFTDLIMAKETPERYAAKDAELKRTLTVKDFLALGVGTIVSTSIFTLPGTVAAEYAGPAVVLSFVFAAIVAGLVAFAYAEMASAMPFAGSAYSWISVVFSKFWGWVAGWALLAEYFIAIAFVASGLSANLQGLLGELGFKMPTALASANHTAGGYIDVIALLSIVLVAVLMAWGTHNTARTEAVLVILKVAAILVFILVGATVIHPSNYVPFIPEASKNFVGGWSGIYAGVSTIFLSYIGFDSIAANSAEAKDPQKTMPRGILGSLLIAVVLFVAVSLVLVGMFKYTDYAGNAEPVGWALRHSGFAGVAAVVQGIAVVGMFTALIGMMLAGSRLLYAFGRDKMLPAGLGKVSEKRNQPMVALVTITLAAIVIGALFPFAELAQLISAGTLIAFMFVSIGIYALRKREGVDIQMPSFKMPFYPVMPALAFLGALLVFLGLSADAKTYSAVWFLVGIVVFFIMNRKSSNS
jgi:APA family basic amino acid/polyamine antiporter